MSEATILLVDDEPDLREIFGMWFELAGCRRVYTARDGESALEVIKSKSIDLLVTDVRMPIMDGIALVRSLGTLGKPIPKIIFVSGFGDIDRREMYAMGVEAFLPKPIATELLIESAEKALEERSALWDKPMNYPPKQSMHFHVEEISQTVRQDSIRLGRGGFSTHYPGQLSLGKVAFSCQIGSGEREMIGEGFVRWRSRDDDKVGVEFAFLTANCRSWLVDEIAAIGPGSFIPSLL